MLRELSVQNLALIEDARIDLRPGYCSWTGETGAGKSLLLTALGLVLGGKASSDLIRTGKDEARAAVAIDLGDPDLRDDLEAILGGAIDDDQLILTRRVATTGRSAAHANGLPVPISTLKALGERLIDIHGQHASRALLDPDHQRHLLDAFGAVESTLAAFRQARDHHKSLLDRRNALIHAAADRERERALLVFESEELLAAAPIVGEHDDLTREAHRLGNAEQVRTAAQSGFALLYESDRSAQGLLEKVARMLAPLSEAVPEFADASADLERIADEAREIAYALRRFGQNWDDDPERLEAVETRLALYRRLATRYRCDPDQLAERLESSTRQLAALETASADLAALDAPIGLAWAEVIRSAAVLTAARQQVCDRFSRAVGGHLKPLGLGDAHFAVDLATHPIADDPGLAAAPEAGFDRIEIQFAPNTGEPARPLRKVASGGELSRVMLAVKLALATADRVPTLVFDEIDTGVGGRLGAAIGRKLAELAEHHQVICVTHLPQVASYADHQWIIRKETNRGRTQTTINPLDESGRVDEIAAMLRGDSATAGTRQEAVLMLAEARVPR